MLLARVCPGRGTRIARTAPGDQPRGRPSAQTTSCLPRRWRRSSCRPTPLERWTPCALVRAVLPETRHQAQFHFSHPREVVAYRELSEDEKRRILLDWLQDELALLVAD